jgi:SulP family sulfate permease
MNAPRRGAAVWRGDVFAGISVALVLLPQAIAYAALAGLPPSSGLIAAIVAPIAAAFLVSSPYLQTGPVAMTSLLTFGTLVVIAPPLSATYLELAALLALVVGVIRVLIGLLRAGFVVYLMSEPVLVGFSSAVALLILGSQLPAAFGVSLPGQDILGNLLRLFAHPDQWDRWALLMTLMSFALIEGGRTRWPRFPWILCAVIGGLALSHTLDYRGPVLGLVQAGLALPSLSLPWGMLPALLIPGAVIALVGFSEAAAISRSMAARNRETWDADREFLSQGAANLAAGLFGGMPVGGSFSRTILSQASGGRTRMAGLVTGITVLLLLPLTGFLAELPRAVLAAVLISSVAKLVDLGAMLALLRISPAQASVSLVTFFATLLLAPRIDLAVFIGISSAVGVHLWRERRIQIKSELEGSTLRLEALGVLYFGSAPLLEEALVAELARYPAADRLVLDLRRVGRIDYSSALILRRVVAQAEGAGLTVRVLPGFPPQAERILRQVFGKDARCLADDPPAGS